MIQITQVFKRDSDDLLATRKFLASIEPDERARLIQFFADMMAQQKRGPQALAMTFYAGGRNRAGII